MVSSDFHSPFAHESLTVSFGVGGWTPRRPNQPGLSLGEGLKRLFSTSPQSRPSPSQSNASLRRAWRGLSPQPFRPLRRAPALGSADRLHTGSAPRLRKRNPRSYPLRGSAWFLFCL